MLFADLDGVFVDFLAGVSRLYGVEHAKVLANWSAGDWCVLPALSKTIDREVTEDEMWDRIHNVGERFWMELEMLPHGMELWRELVCFAGVGNIRFLSSPSRCPSSYSGKARWVKDYFGSAKYLIPTPDKHLLARNRRDVLLDDSEKNCDGFLAMGGTSILFPSIQNRLHYLTDPLTYVKTSLVSF